jgi:hypothetical protein
MATLVSLNDAIYSLAYWIGAATEYANGATNEANLDQQGQAVATNVVTNAAAATVSGYVGITRASLDV